MKYHVDFDIDLKRNPYKGLYIAFEGIDGSGKTTQTELLTKYFKSKGKEVIQTREPRKEGIIGDIVLKVLTGKLKMSHVALQYLFSTDRVLNHEELILPSLKKGNIVISDRCFWSAIVYGILDRGEGQYDYKNADFLLIAHSILSMYHQFTVPDYTFYLKISLETSTNRISKKTDFKQIYEDKEKLKQIVSGYNWLVEKFNREIITVDGEKSEEEVTQQIVASIK
ncbi:dTMP kinase [Candidatus Roizmanbacteria bacterium]|nr:dTMP kinase [Candidatus Roizmanbacteria bacterium]